MDESHLPPPRVVHRALGLHSARDRLGIGVMDKAGVRHDQVDTDPPTFSLVYVLRGRGRYREADGRTHALAPGACFIRIPGRIQSTELDPDSRWLEVFIDLGTGLPALMLDLRFIRPEFPVWDWGLSPTRVGRFTALLAELEAAGERDLPGLWVRSQALVLEAVRAQEAGDRASEDPIDRLCRLLAEEAGARLDLRSFCRREGLDFERFRKDFTRRLGQSPGQYRIRRRIDRACSLLMTTTDDLAVIAAQLGYASPYEFSAQFRQWTGQPPGRWRVSAAVPERVPGAAAGGGSGGRSGAPRRGRTAGV
jgi:AraC-like DNA-binding protein